MNNTWIDTDKYGEVFVTHDNIGWIVDKSLTSRSIPLTPADMKPPTTSLFRTSIKVRGRRRSKSMGFNPT
jgi:hypothetical protein